MGWLTNAFTWWNGASWGTSIVSRMRGREVGRDDEGNVYFVDKNDPARRWVIYDGANDGSRVPPAWQAWLRGSVDGLPNETMPPRRKFQIKPTANLTGTIESFRPGGSLGAGGIRPASTGDYEPWTPE